MPVTRATIKPYPKVSNKGERVHNEATKMIITAATPVTIKTKRNFNRSTRTETNGARRLAKSWIICVVTVAVCRIFAGTLGDTAMPAPEAAGLACSESHCRNASDGRRASTAPPPASSSNCDTMLSKVASVTHQRPKALAPVFNNANTAARCPKMPRSRRKAVAFSQRQSRKVATARSRPKVDSEASSATSVAPPKRMPPPGDGEAWVELRRRSGSPLCRLATFSSFSVATKSVAPTALLLPDAAAASAMCRNRGAPVTSVATPRFRRAEASTDMR
mmetsp:Transcript_8444/g.24265  ORF Transcript_8444/g.24265 Transcript_8444/m.24265 type:complete len:276 (+) Transcript_8444:2256-3083(+)